MNEHTQPTPAPAQASQPLTDALTLWRTEMPSAGPTALSLIRLGPDERLVIPFTPLVVRASVHFVNDPAGRSYIHCGGHGCLLCRLGRQVETRDLLPLFDILDKVVGVLPVSRSLRPRALQPQLLPVLQRLEKQGRLLLGIRKPDNVSFVVTSYDLPATAADGADVIAAFKEQFDAGRIDLGSVYARVSNEELAAVPEVATLMAAKGVSLA
jgi:hypothetical protein